MKPGSESTDPEVTLDVTAHKVPGGYLVYYKTAHSSVKGIAEKEWGSLEVLQSYLEGVVDSLRAMGYPAILAWAPPDRWHEGGFRFTFRKTELDFYKRLDAGGNLLEGSSV